MRNLSRRFIAFWRKYRAEILIFLAVFGVRFVYSLVVLFGFGQDAFVSYLDAEVFVREASNLLEYSVMSQFPDPPFLPDPLRTPFYIWFLALFLKLGFSYFGIVTVQNLLTALSGVFLYRIGAAVFRDRLPGLIAAGLFAVEPSSVYWSNMLMSDVLFAFVFITAVFLFVHKRWYESAAVFGLLTLTRPLGLYLFPLLLFMTVVTYFHANAAGVRERFTRTGVLPLLLRLVLMSMIFALLVSPWMLRNKVLFNHFELSTAGWLNLYLFSVKEFAARRGTELPMPQAPESYHPESYRGVLYNYEFESAEFFKERTGEVLRQFPVAYPAFHIFSGLRGLLNHDYRYLFDHVIRPTVPSFPARTGEVAIGIGNALWFIVFAGVLAGFFFRGSRHWPLFFATLALVNTLLIGYNGVISSGGRYQLPFVPLLLLLGTYGAVRSYRWIQRKITHHKIQITNNTQ